ncbi:MAG: NAD(P)H-hydrate dehydratase [Candidatus Omnitrophica bacterium]|nr:NAD(P)H-hydrate dehydratase [Candidatus Omnitrophota bacterium]MDD5665036.1 NAD(P)H-hydrate dehydratase [Candidatus Omnitrophota bacterium]
MLRRRLKSNKGDFGRIFILAGSSQYSGAAILCSLAALRSGAGLVTLGIPQGINSAIIKIKPVEVMTLPLPETKEGSLGISGFDRIKTFLEKCDLAVIGPGLTQNISTHKLLLKLLSKIDKPMVIDADGLNALVGHLNLLSNMHVLTPHPKEMSRLSGLSISDIQGNRSEVAKKFAKKYKITLVLKGHKTVVSDYSGNLYINKTGNPGMATAGSGDVLTGMIAAFMGQGLGAFEAGKFAVYLHGLAGDLAAKEKTQISLIASDIIDKITEALKRAS